MRLFLIGLILFAFVIPARADDTSPSTTTKSTAPSTPKEGTISEPEDSDMMESDIRQEVTEDEPEFETNLSSAEFDGWQLHSPYFHPPTKKWMFHDALRAGAVFTTGNSQSVSVAGKNTFTVRKRMVTNTLKGGGVHTRGKSSGVTSTTARFYYFRDDLAWQFHKVLYSFAGGGFYSDKTQGVNEDIRGQAGIGAYLVDGPKHTFQIQGGYNYERELRQEFGSAIEQGDHIHAFIMGWAYTLRFNSFSNLQHNAEWLIDMQHGDNIRLHSSTDLIFHIWKHLGFAFGVDVRFDNIPVSGYKKVDTIESGSVLVTF